MMKTKRRVFCTDSATQKKTAGQRWHTLGSVTLYASLLLLVQMIFFAPPMGAQESSAQPVPLNIPSYIHAGDVTAEFVKEKDLDKVIPASLIQLGNAQYFSNYAFIVDKGARSLSIWFQEGESWQRVGHYPTDMGKKAGDKHILGDHRTPEGIYFMTDRYEGKNLDYTKYGSRAFATNYPNLFDRREGKTGSGIWLHAVPDSTPLTRGSRGCVVVRDEIIKKVTRFVSLGKTPIIILEREKYLQPAKWRARRRHVQGWLNRWLEAWQKQDMSQYMDFYSQKNFLSKKMNWLQWKNYKQRLKKKYDFIRVSLSEPTIYSHGSEYIVQFMQNYRSDLFNDFGQKTLHIKEEEGQLKIISETWQKTQPLRWTAVQSTTVGSRNPKDYELNE